MLPDGRMRFPPTLIDFDADVGVTGQDHDNYPAAGQQPRWDWMRMALIALLSNQAAYEPPTQGRDGTLWFDLTDGTMRIRVGGAWLPLASAISLGPDPGGVPVSLLDFYGSIKAALGSRPTATFSGAVVTDGTTSLPIPAALASASGPGSRPFVWVNGLLLDPRLCSYLGGEVAVGVPPLASRDTFTVLLVSISDPFFHVPDVGV